MDSLQYIREGNRNNIRISVSEDEILSRYHINMICENSFENLLQASYLQMDNKYVIDYDITSKQAFSNIVIRNAITSGMLMQLILAIKNMMEELSKYMLNINCILLETDKIMYSQEEKKFSFIYYPVSGSKFEDQLKILMEEMLKHVDHTDSDTVIHAYGLYSEIQKDNYSIDDLLKIFDRTFEPAKEINVMPEPVKETVEIKNNKTNKLVNITELIIVLGIAAAIVMMFMSPSMYQKKIILGVAALLSASLIAFHKIYEIKWKNKSSFTEKVVMADYNQEFTVFPDIAPNSKKPSNTEQNNFIESSKIDEYKTILLANIADKAFNDCYLEFENPEEREIYGGNISITEDTIIIGCRKEICDFVIDNPAISRMHAKISRDGKRYFITDLNSTNGTTVNDTRLMENEIREIFTGDRVELGNIKLKLK